MRDGCLVVAPSLPCQDDLGSLSLQARKLVQCTFLSELDKCHVSRVTRTHSKGEKEDGRRINSSHSRPGIRKANRAPQTCEKWCHTVRRYFLPRSSCMKVLCTRGQTQEPEGPSHPGAGCIATAAERSKQHILSVACIRHHPLVCLSIPLASTNMSHLTHLS